MPMPKSSSSPQDTTHESHSRSASRVRSKLTNNPTLTPASRGRISSLQSLSAKLGSKNSEPSPNSTDILHRPGVLLKALPQLFELLRVGEKFEVAVDDF